MKSGFIFEVSLLFIPIAIGILFLSEVAWIFFRYRLEGKLSRFKWHIYAVCVTMFVSGVFTVLLFYSLEMKTLRTNINSMDIARINFVDKLLMDCECFKPDVSRIDNGNVVDVINFTKKVVKDLYPVIIAITTVGIIAILIITTVEVTSRKYSGGGKLIMLAFTTLFLLVGSSLIASTIMADGFNYISHLVKTSDEKFVEIISGRLPCIPTEFISPNGIPILEYGKHDCGDGNGCYYPIVDVFIYLIDLGGYGSDFLYNKTADETPCLIESTQPLQTNVDVCSESMPSWLKCIGTCVGKGEFNHTLKETLCDFQSTTEIIINKDFERYTTVTNALIYTVLSLSILLIFGTVGADDDIRYEKGESIMMTDYAD